MSLLLHIPESYYLLLRLQGSSRRVTHPIGRCRLDSTHSKDWDTRDYVKSHWKGQIYLGSLPLLSLESVFPLHFVLSSTFSPFDSPSSLPLSSTLLSVHWQPNIVTPDGHPYVTESPPTPRRRDPRPWKKRNLSVVVRGLRMDDRECLVVSREIVSRSTSRPLTLRPGETYKTSFPHCSNMVIQGLRVYKGHSSVKKVRTSST